ncbi:fimbria/pilus periplasmic chaperone [Escherichia coli]|nr:fimbria/pilus periplasmic chaperone [Escherichia coli]WCE54396.1 fimbria/pilus periplasmic chaperone [Escherichia coli]
MLPTRKEASLRIMFLGKTNLPTDRETLYWMNVKAIPPTDERNTQKNTLQLALQNKIKLFYRPENLPVQPGKARNMLRFKYEGKQLKVINPSPGRGERGGGKQRGRGQRNAEHGKVSRSTRARDMHLTPQKDANMMRQNRWKRVVTLLLVL